MKRSCILLLFAGALLASGSQFVVNFNAADLHFSRVSNYDLVTLLDLPTLTEVGMPGLPVKTVHVALLPGERAVSIKVIDVETDTLEGIYKLLPVQPPKKTSDNERNILGPEKKYYSHALYPEKIAEIAGNGDIAGQALCAVRIYPLAYIPQPGILILRKKITIEIETESAPAPRGIKLTSLTKALYERELKELVINPRDVKLRAAAPTSTKLNPGDYEYVIITTSSLQSYWNQLLNWKKRKGINDTIVNVTWIYNNYSGSDDQEKIRNFIIDANSTWGTIWFLIGADADQIPMKVKQFYVDDWYDVPSDYYYADYDDDWYQEVFVGRAPVDNYSQTNIFIGKVLKYEKDPPTTNYPLNVLLIGMDLDGSTQSENVKEYIDNYYIPSRFNVNKVYDSDGGNHKDSALYYLNVGQNLVNHSDHSDWYVLGVGYTNHGWSLYRSDIDGLSNTYKTCIFYSLGCWSNAFDYNDAISEHFIVYNSNEAGVAYIGNTRYGWYSPGYYNNLSMLMDREWWRSLFNYDKYKIGQTLANSKNRNYPNDNTMKYIHYELCLLGDPEMPIWTNTPQPLTVSHPDTIAAWAGDYTVVVYSNGSPVDSAYVCLYKDGEVYERGYTNSSGQATFNINPTSEGIMYVTVTKHNYIPYQGESYVTSGPPVADFTANPTSGVTPLTVQFTDLSSGYITSWHWFFGDGGESYEQNPSHIYTFEGSFDVTLIVSGPMGTDTMTKWNYIDIVCDNVMVPETATATAGGNINIHLLGRTTFNTNAFQIGACFDTSLITVDSLSLHGTVFDTAWGGEGPDYANFHIYPSGKVEAAIMFDLNLPFDKQLGPLSGEPILTFHLTIKDDVVPPDTLLFNLSNDCGENLYTDTVPQSIYPCLFTSPIYVVEAPTFVRSDVNADGNTNVTDVTYLVNHLFPPSFACQDAADCNDDGALNVSDAVYLLNHLFPPSFPAPFPNCGIDPTDDALECDSFPPCGSRLNQSLAPNPDNTVDFVLSENDSKLVATIVTHTQQDVGAFQFEVRYRGSQLKLENIDFLSDVSKFEILRTYEELNKVIVYGLYGLEPYKKGITPVMPAGSNSIARITFSVKRENYIAPNLSNAVLSDPFGYDLYPSINVLSKDKGIPSVFKLYPSEPNPMKNSTAIKFSLPFDSHVDLIVYNSAGQKVKTLISGFQKAGIKQIIWDGLDEKGVPVSNGVYFYMVKASGHKAIGKLILAR